MRTRAIPPRNTAALFLPSASRPSTVGLSPCECHPSTGGLEMALNRAKVLENADKLVRQGKLDEAIKHYLVLSEDNPRDVNTINRIGDLYVRLRKNKEA